MAETTYNAESDVRRAATKLADGAVDVASQAAESVSTFASRAQEKAAAFREKAVNRLGDTATYFREHDVKEMASDLKGWVKDHPTQALIGAVAVGFVAGALLRRR